MLVKIREVTVVALIVSKETTSPRIVVLQANVSIAKESTILRFVSGHLIQGKTQVWQLPLNLTQKCRPSLQAQLQMHIVQHMGRPILLQTAHTVVYNPLKPKLATELRLLLDSGSQPYLTERAKVMSRSTSTPDATSLHHCLNNKQLKLIWLQW